MEVPRRIVLCLPEGMPRTDPAPEETAKRDVGLAFDWDGSALGVAGFAEGGWEAFELASAHPDLIDRLVLVATPPREGDTDGMAAKTLLVFGQQDPDGGYAHGKWWRDALGARLEMVPNGGRDILERAWPRVPSHLAPRTLRK